MNRPYDIRMRERVRLPSPFAARRSRGFTLIEAALVTVIIGVGVMGMLQLLAAGTVQNSAGAKMTTALALAGNIRELTLDLAYEDPTQIPVWGAEAGETTLASYDDVDDLDGRTFNPPIDARRQVIASQTEWTQYVSIQCVDPDLIASAVPDAGSPMARVTVTVLCAGEEICSSSWLVVDPDH